MNGDVLFVRALFQSRELVEDNPRIGRNDLDAVSWLRRYLLICLLTYLLTYLL